MHQLQYVVAVAEERHFTRAAAALRVAQPSVSAAVRGLERELGAPLFHRTRGSVQLTGAGQVFLPWARQVLADCEAGRSSVRELLGLQGGRLALGATPSLTTHVLPAVLAGYHQRYPGVELVLHQAGSRDLVTDLEQGRLELALVILPVPGPRVRAVALAEEELVLAVAPSHPLAGGPPIPVTALAGVPLVMVREGYDLREATLAACREAGFEPRLAVEGGEMDGVLALTAAGLGAAVVPATVVERQPGLRAVRFAGTRLTRTVGLAFRQDRPLPRAAEAFMALLHGAFGAPDATGQAQSGSTRSGQTRSGQTRSA